MAWGLDYYLHNGGLELGLRSVFGYDPLGLQRFDDFVASWPDVRARTFDLLNAGYAIPGVPLELPDVDWLEMPRLVHEESGWYVYERPSALPRAWVTTEIEVHPADAVLARIHQPDFDPRSTALVEEPVVCEGVVSGQEGEGSGLEIVRARNRLSREASTKLVTRPRSRGRR